MNKEKALELLEQGMELANKAGAFNMQTAAVLYNALVVLKQPEAEKENEVKTKESK